MGMITRTVRNLTGASSFAQMAISSFQHGRAQLPDARYETLAREGYQKNELVFAAIEERATSAAEPRMKAKVGDTWTETHKILDLLNRPNPFMDRFEFWATVIMHGDIAGDAFALVVESASTRPVELWLMRPDKVRVVPSRDEYISHYEYDAGGGEVFPLPVRNVIHWRRRNPISGMYGYSPLMAAAGRVDVDNYMKDFVKSFFQNAGMPSGMLAIKSKASPELKQEIRGRWKADYGGPKVGELLILDQTEANFTSFTSNLGAQGLVMPELDEINEARILMPFQVPPELIGARVGMKSSSYAQKRAARESFWDETLAPLYVEMAGPLNLRLVPRFPGVAEVAFDLQDIRARLEDVDKIHARTRSDYNSGLISIQEARKAIGYPEEIAGTFLIPGNLNPTPAERIGEPVEEPSEPAATAAGS